MRIRPNDEFRHEWRKSLEQRRGLKRSTILAKLAAVHRFEVFTNERPFLKLSSAQVAGFKEHLLTLISPVTGKPLSSSTLVHTLDHCRDFFTWFMDQKDGRTLDREAVSWFTATRADKARARAVPPRQTPALDEAKAAFAAMPTDTLRDRRDRAVFAMMVLTGIRVNAIASLQIGLVDLAARSVWLDARFVRTKNTKSFTVFFLPFVDEARGVMEDWINELKGFGLTSTDALFPRDAELLRIESGERLPPGEYPVWQDASQVRAIVRRAFKVAGLPSYTPHVFRHMFARKVLASDPPVGTFVAFSQNLGHEKPDVTLGSYARPDDQTRARLIAKLDGKPARDGAFELHAMVRELNRLDLDQVIKIFSDYMKSQK